MIGLGTLIDVTLILLGGFAGLAFGRFIIERIQDTLLKATAVAIIFSPECVPSRSRRPEANHRGRARATGGKTAARASHAAEHGTVPSRPRALW